MGKEREILSKIHLSEGDDLEEFVNAYDDLNITSNIKEDFPKNYNKDKHELYWTPLMIACKYARKIDPKLIKEIISRSNINAQDNEGYTALMLASIYSNDSSSENTVQMLLDTEANVNI